MKKYLIAVLLLFIPCVTYALTMCARDNSLVISLASGVVGANKTGVNNPEYLWSVGFSYGTLVGEATCLSANEVERDLKDIPKGLHGKDNTSTDRLYCYCRMTHPALSGWGGSNKFVSAYDCINTCASYCARNVNAGDTYLRKALFNSIGR